MKRSVGDARAFAALGVHGRPSRCFCKVPFLRFRICGESASSSWALARSRCYAGLQHSRRQAALEDRLVGTPPGGALSLAAAPRRCRLREAGVGSGLTWASGWVPVSPLGVRAAMIFIGGTASAKVSVSALSLVSSPRPASTVAPKLASCGCRRHRPCRLWHRCWRRRRRIGVGGCFSVSAPVSASVCGHRRRLIARKDADVSSKARRGMQLDGAGGLEPPKECAHLFCGPRESSNRAHKTVLCDVVLAA